MKQGSPRILIIRLSAIGDVVRALPILHVLREALPNARIDWIVERRSAAVVEGHPYLDTLHIFERQKQFWPSLQAFRELCRTIRAEQYDIVLDAHGILKSGVLMACSGARRRIGFAPPRAQELSYLFSNRRVRLGKAPLNRVEENLQLCHCVTPRVTYPSVTIYVPTDVQEHVDRFFDETFDGGKYVLAVHAPVERPEKQWPLDYFAALCDLLLADGRYDVLLTWGPGQFEIAEQVMHACRRKPVMAPETPDLKHYAWLIHRANLYFGGDTGPMHIASAMGTPVVAVFGGTDPVRHAPYRPPRKVLYTQDEPGWRRMPAKERLRRITPEMAYDACVRLLAETHSPASSGSSFD